ncbi:hypothetical protein BU17DRAFT_79621 [Hysterangium stoloniferum]|nr:hypothetical protein BU17DRAFT_79621 [Hysterangium stoloniferum]
MSTHPNLIPLTLLESPTTILYCPYITPMTPIVLMTFTPNRTPLTGHKALATPSYCLEKPWTVPVPTIPIPHPFNSNHLHTQTSPTTIPLTQMTHSLPPSPQPDPVPLLETPNDLEILHSPISNLISLPEEPAPSLCMSLSSPILPHCKKLMEVDTPGKDLIKTLPK